LQPYETLRGVWDHLLMALTTVHLLRHGEVHNPDGVLYGRLPGFRLSELGERQAVAAAEWLAGRDIAHLVARRPCCGPSRRRRRWRPRRG
jgi:broad specificity phosphatase PhoE